MLLCLEQLLLLSQGRDTNSSDGTITKAQDRTQLTVVSAFILRTVTQMLSDRTGVLQKVPVRVVGVFGITDVCVAVADTAPTDADILDAVVILESTRKVGHYCFYRPDS